MLGHGFICGIQHLIVNTLIVMFLFLGGTVFVLFGTMIFLQTLKYSIMKTDYIKNIYFIKKSKRNKTNSSRLQHLIIISVLFSLFFTSCLKDDIDEDVLSLSNKERMHQLQINNPSIWNSLTVQTIDLTTLDTQAESLKSAFGKMQEYPKGGKYYFSLFEDLFPSEGDYDFNDIIIKSKLGLSKKGNEITGYIDSELVNKGGSLPVAIGLMFYKVEGKKYTRIPNKTIKINGVQLEAGGLPWKKSSEKLGEKWKLEFEINHKSNNIWINYFIYTDREILTSGFAPSEVKEEFEVPQSDFLTDRNLPWGLEIEAKSFAIPNEKELFLNAYPEFEEWATSGGTKNKKWFESPDENYSHYNIQRLHR